MSERRSLKNNCVEMHELLHPSIGAAPPDPNVLMFLTKKGIACSLLLDDVRLLPRFIYLEKNTGQ